MNNQSDNLDIKNQGNFKTLVRSITLSQGEFSLILLRCNYGFVQQQIFTKLQELETVKISKIDLPLDVKTLYTNIAAQLENAEPAALMVFGLESIQNIDTVLTSANRVREQFRNDFRFPLFFWVNDQILTKIIRLAPDFKNWATTIEFNTSTNQLINFIQQEIDTIFAGDITNLIFSNLYPELAAAKQDLQQQEEVLNPTINASLEYIFGYRDYLDDNLDSALEHYQQSLDFWQENNNLDRQGTLLVNIGLIYYRKAFINQVDNQKSWEEAEKYFQQSLEIFKQTQQTDSLSSYIILLCEVYLNLQAWEELEKLVNESLNLHQNQDIASILLAKDYGFLAELALHKSNFNEAKHYAETALETLKTIIQQNIVHIPKNEDVYYQFLLAKSYQGLGDIPTTLEKLEAAKNNTEIEYNPKLYIDILDKLNLLYFQQGEYLKAFNTKQEKLQIEQQYGFRAFVGASYLNPQWKIIQSTTSEIAKTGTIAQEISASGREQDVKKLRGRIAQNQYKLTIIHGQSGVGKSSILQAGLIPALQQETIDAKQVLPILLRAYTNWVEKLGECLNLNISNIHYSTIIQQLQKNNQNNLLTVLIFDQFEEFFFVYKEQTERQPFYDFLRQCLDIPDLKIVLSLREDYLHYLLELERKFANLKDTDIVNSTDILTKSIRYYLGNFIPQDAKEVFTSLTKRSKYPLNEDLITKLVQDLAGDIGEIRPIELQIVGTQLENQKITTLEKYQEIGNKETLVQGFLQNVIKDCGEENEKLAKLVLYLLTDENKTRPLKTHAELLKELALFVDHIEFNELKLVLKILVISGLVLLIQESPENRYQLVHDYLVDFIRQQQKDEDLANFAKTKEELTLAAKKLKQEQEARQILANAKIQADAQIAKAQKRLKLSSSLAVGFLGSSFVYATIQFKEVNIAKQVTKLEQGGVNVLRQFQLEKLPSLVNAVQNAKTLKQLVKNSPLEKYPTISPIYTLNTILDNIKELNQFQGHKDSVLSVSFSPDGKTIATASRDKTARLWNLQGQLLQEFKGHQKDVLSVSFSPDGKTIATTSEDKTARLWNLQGQLLQQFKGHQKNVLSVSFSPDGKTIATASRDKTARLWNLKGQLLQQFKGHQDFVYSVVFSPDGKTIATASSDKTARLWNLKGKMLQEFKHQDSVYQVSFSPNGKTIATASNDNKAQLWNLKGKMLQEFKHQDSVLSVSFSPDGKTIATGSSDNKARLWDLQWQMLQEFKGHKNSVLSVSFSPDGKTIATASRDNTARLWNLKGELLQEFKGHHDSVWNVNFSPNGQTIATASSDKTARLWNLKGELLQEFKHQDSVLSVSFSPDGKTIATASDDNKAQLWNLRGELLQEFIGHQGTVNSVKFSPDGKTIATASDDNTARLWTLKGELLQEFKGHENSVLSVSFSPDGKTIATASRGSTARLWNLQGELLQEFKGHQDAVWSVSFSPDGKTIATASRDQTVRLWDLQGQPLQEFNGHQARVWSVSFSPDCETIATASSDKTARLLPVRNLDRLLVDGCEYLQDYLQNPGVNLSNEDRRLCDDIKAGV